MPEPSHARCVPQEDYARLMQMKEVQALQRELAQAREDGERP
jgi:hypothetical protein